MCEGRWASDGAAATLAVFPNDVLLNVVITISSGGVAGWWQETEIGVFWQDVLKSRRPRLHCRRCGTRLDVLYLVEFEFICRDCGDLAYPSQVVLVSERPRVQAETIRESFGGPRDINTPFPARPKGVHRERYARERQRALELEFKYRESSCLLKTRNELIAERAKLDEMIEFIDSPYGARWR